VWEGLTVVSWDHLENRFLKERFLSSGVCYAVLI
ncbi:hypothetical protein scyTo_0019564, partial [Scyliorhinus torazame]|nr:hypothetical protein [Scyliorhinus torazame]